MREPALPQKTRFVLLLFEVGILCLASWIAFGRIFPPDGEKGFWFYTALLGLILGSRLDTPFYVKPADVILYAAPAAVALIRPFNNTASMASLSPSEITHIISDATLQAVSALGMTHLARVCLVYEEAHSLVPEWSSAVAEGDRAATNGSARAILQGRKYGLGCLLVTQRTANVTKTILNQCNTIFAMRTFDETGKEFLANYIGKDYAGSLSSLAERHAVLFGKASSCENPILIRLNDREKFVEVFRSENPPPNLPRETANAAELISHNSGMDDDIPF